MRLIKATTENPLGIFDNTFNSAIRINPKSKICLASLTSDEAVEGLTIDDTNDTIRVQLIGPQASGGGGFKTINLTHNAYSDLQFGSFFEDFTRKLNATIPSSGKGIGYEYKVALDNNRRVNILGKQYTYQTQPQLWKNNNTEVAIASGGNGVFNAISTTPTDTNNVNINLELPWCNGGAIFSCRIHTLKNEADANKTGFIMGLSKVSPTQNPNYNDGRIEHGIQVRRIADNYSFYHKGTLTQSTTAPQPIVDGSPKNDLLVLSLNENFYEYKIFNQANPNGKLLHTPNLFPRTSDDYKPLFPFIAFQGSKTTCKVMNVSFTASPYSDNPLNLDGTAENQFSLGADPTQTTLASRQFVEFASTSLANYLGFENQRNPFIIPPPNVKELTLIADDLFIPTSFTDSFTLELLNVAVDSYSYDGQIGERRNILAVVPQSYNTLNQIIYQAPNLLWLDLLNAYPVDLRELKMRLLRADNSPLRIRGITTAVILIKEENE